VSEKGGASNEKIKKIGGVKDENFGEENTNIKTMT